MARGLRRFYVNQVFPRVGSRLRLSPRETFHLHRVLRLKKGDPCQLFNRAGQAAEAVLESVSESEGAKLRVKKIFSLSFRALFLKVAQALPQKKKMDFLVEKAEELEVQELWVLETQRSVVRMRGEARERARSRWERIVTEAAKQSGSPVLTRIEGPLPFSKVLAEGLLPQDRGFLFHPDPKGLSFGDLVREIQPESTPPTPRSLFLFFGSEGGFTEEEVRLAESRGIRKVFLGRSILRLETAFLGVVSALRFLIP